MKNSTATPIIAVVPAAGVGRRMQADRPKQYLMIHGKTILEHTVENLLLHPSITKVVIATSDDDPYFPLLALAKHPQVERVSGGKERADSVLSALNTLIQQGTSEQQWLCIHDAARPCITIDDLDRLIVEGAAHPVGALLASPVRDTMKRGHSDQHIESTVSRENLWHALTPQMFRLQDLKFALEHAITKGQPVTDEASALELIGRAPLLVNGRADNIKVTQPEDLALAEFYLSRKFNEKECV